MGRKKKHAATGVPVRLPDGALTTELKRLGDPKYQMTYWVANLQPGDRAITYVGGDEKRGILLQMTERKDDELVFSDGVDEYSFTVHGERMDGQSNLRGKGGEVEAECVTGLFEATRDRVASVLLHNARKELRLQSFELRDAMLVKVAYMGIDELVQTMLAMRQLTKILGVRWVVGEEVEMWLEDLLEDSDG